MKVTDLEKFVLEQVFRPFQTDLGIEKRMKGLMPLYNLDTVLTLFVFNPEWRDCVIDRIKRIPNLRFPDYIHHPLVDYIQSQQDKDKGGV